MHGANRMGGNALTETLVFGYRAGIASAEYSRSRERSENNKREAQSLLQASVNLQSYGRAPGVALQTLREIMWEKCGPIRYTDRLISGSHAVERLKEEGVCCNKAASLSAWWSVWNSLDTAKIIIESAIARTESIGAHRRVA